MMTKRLKIWLVLLLVGAGITAGGAGYMKYQEHKEREAMLEIVKSEEAKEIFENWIYKEDPNAFTDEGIIRNYQIDYDSIEKSPMGGLFVTLIINNKPELDITCTINKNKGKLESNSSTVSPELTKLIEVEGGQ
ncbi:DUF1310 family protein [Streptococcus chenjunshii]|uniref:DUF1310 family protein n=2 Tax=Streptococcus chenjunshii TaxID=2173853 RepID=A0A346NA27_9STRE|nr:DUF1310 family protein [Streptococcus chenjunshii]AXQ77872.1 DUF1310 family protein [Streptococcus chenjunshii]